MGRSGQCLHLSPGEDLWATEGSPFRLPRHITPCFREAARTLKRGGAMEGCQGEEGNSGQREHKRKRFESEQQSSGKHTSVWVYMNRVVKYT